MPSSITRTDAGYFLQSTAGITLFPLGADLAAIAAGSPGEPVSAITGTPLPVVQPAKVGMVGLNFPSHAAEAGLAVPQAPMLMVSPAEGLTPEDWTVVRPAEAPHFLDYEIEIGAVLGRPCHNASVEEAAAAIIGYVPLIDMSLRDVQFRALLAMREGHEGPHMRESKIFPTSKPIGPEMILSGELGPEPDMPFALSVNGTVRQTGNVRDQVFAFARLVADASRLEPLEAGDVVSGGTPAGVGYVAGTFLEPGDVVEARLADAAPLRVTIA
jgi:2-keto-4-pentenoate hydratase/2-oxohepta-3-ene-1,7-dioic acid hydratase in catechol pathway